MCSPGDVCRDGDEGDGEDVVPRLAGVRGTLGTEQWSVVRFRWQTGNLANLEREADSEEPLYGDGRSHEYTPKHANITEMVMVHITVKIN